MKERVKTRNQEKGKGRQKRREDDKSKNQYQSRLHMTKESGGEILRKGMREKGVPIFAKEKK